MATNSSQLQETILKAIDAVVTQRNNDLKLDKTITGIVKKNVGKRGSKPLYQIGYGGGIIEAVTQSVDDVYFPHNSVYVLVPEGNFSNEKIIIGRATSINTDRSASVVAAAVNKYSIVGANLLKSNNEEKIQDITYGLYSFHPSTYDSTHGIEHRAQFLYRKDDEEAKIKFEDDRLNVYKEDATAIMVKADFKTNLDSIQKQQSGARYGLIFNFAFDNLNKGYGETNGDILHNISEIITRVNENGKSERLSDQISAFEESLFDSSSSSTELSDWINNNTGQIDILYEKVDAYYNAFKVDNAKLNKEIISHTIQSYLILLSELKYEISVPNIAQNYKDWMEERVGDDSQKNIQFTLTSDDMIGNPFNFNRWNTQYSVFEIDLETFNHLDSILFYKEGFYEDGTAEASWPIDKPGPDIFVKNLQIYAMNPLDNQSGDYTLSVEPYAGQDIFLSNKGSSLHPSTTQFKALLLRKFYEDLTTNGKTNFIWFKEDSSVYNSSCVGYNYLAGAGWREIDHKETNYLFTTSIEDNPAYKNNYKCVAVYEPAVDDKTILSFIFSVYNEDVKTEIKLESDLGTQFSFDAGQPTITVLINEDKEDANKSYKEYGFNENDLNSDVNRPNYIYNWAISDAANGDTIFLNELFKQSSDDEDNLTYDRAILRVAKDALLKNIKLFNLDKSTTHPEWASRIKYPISITSSGFTVTCYVKHLSDNEYYDVGSASLEFKNKSANVSDFYIHITNGNQIFKYDEYGNTPCNSKRKDALEVKPLQAKLFTPKGIEVQGENYEVEWILPIEDTMIETSENLRLNPRTNLMQSYIGHEFNFSISDIYDPDAYANQITCHVYFRDKDYYKDTNFYFGKEGSNGTNGTDVVAKRDYRGTDLNHILHDEPLLLYVQKNENNEEIKGAFNTNIDTKGLESPIQLVSTPENDYDALKVTLYKKGEQISSNQYKASFPRWSISGNNTDTGNTVAKFFKWDKDALTLSWSYNFQNGKDKFRGQILRASVQLPAEKANESDPMYYAYFTLPIIEYEQDINVKSLVRHNRITIDKNKYLNEVVYNADGRNPIFNHNQGLKLLNLPENAIIYWEAKGGFNGEHYSNSTNNIKEYQETQPDFTIRFDKNIESTSTKLVTKLTTIEEQENTLKRIKAAFELEKQQAQKLYYIEHEDGTIEEKELYLEYKHQWERDKNRAFSYWKADKLKDLQKFVKQAWYYSEDHSLKDNSGIPIGCTYQKDNETYQIYEEEMQTIYTRKDNILDNYWFTANMDLWWDSNLWDESKYKLLEEIDENFVIVETEDETVEEGKTKILSENIFDYDVSLLTPQDYFDSIYQEPAANITEDKNVQVITDRQAMIYVLPNDSYSGAATNNRIEAKIYVPDSSGIKLYVTVYAPINMILNTYGLASVNAWDGNSIKTDEEHGAILAPQIAAGEKDAYNNFTGIVMGKTETYSGREQKEKQVGLFGYAYGNQSIFLDSETGNATFGLPDGVSVQKDNKGNYIGLKADDYNEGRIELRPGDESKIGGWRLGRRSIYYTMTPTQIIEGIREPEDENVEEDPQSYVAEYKYEYSGRIGPRYNQDIGTPLNRQYANHHERDIYPEDSGLLLSADPSYISIKGKKLGENDIDRSLNSQLIVGDSLEIQLDPQTPTLFTIFRHNSENRGEAARGKRQFLAGVNDKGELIANGVAKEDGNGTGTKSGNIVLKAFKDTPDQESGSYVGTVFEAGAGLASTRTFFQIFREKNDPLNTSAQVYMTGGQNTSSGEFYNGLNNNGDEYSRPISIHGNNIALFAKTGSPNEKIGYDENGNSIKAGYNWTSTDANIKISTQEYQTQLGNTKLILTRNNENSLDTRGNLNVNLGFISGWKDLTINSATFIHEINKQEDNSLPSYKCQITNSNGNTTIWTKGNYILRADNGSVRLYSKAKTEGDITGNTEFPYLQLNADPGESEKHIKFGYSGGTFTNLITMNKNSSDWTTSNNSIKITDANQIHIVSKFTGNNDNFTSARPQILLQAGADETGSNTVKFMLNSSNNSWTHTVTTDSGENETRYGSTTIPWFRVSEKQSNGLYFYTIKDSNNIAQNIFAIQATRITANTGIYIQGAAYNATDNRGLTVSANSKGVGGNIYAQKKISAGEGFYGNGKNVTNTADGSSASGAVPNISGVGGTGTIKALTVTLSNGRPTFGTTSGVITMPTTDEIWNAISKKVSSAISNSLAGYAKKGTYYIKNNHLMYDHMPSKNITYVTSVSGGKNEPATGTTDVSQVYLVPGSTQVNANTFYIEI